MINITFHGSHTSYNLAYHMVFITKRRKSVIMGQIREDLEQIIREYCNEVYIKIDTLHIDTDHIHILFYASPTLSIAEIAKKLKGRSSKILREKHPELKELDYIGYDKALWARGYYCCTVGYTSFEEVEKYINEHDLVI